MKAFFDAVVYRTNYTTDVKRALCCMFIQHFGNSPGYSVPEPVQVHLNEQLRALTM
jgi:hypothetical protein